MIVCCCLKYIGKGSHFYKENALMKRIVSLLMIAAVFLGCLPMTAFALNDGDKTVYSANGEKVYFDSEYAEVGVPISVKAAENSTDFLYKWYIDKKQIINSGDSYTPIEADLESMLTAEMYTADGELYGSVSMLISKLPVMYIETENRQPIVVRKKVLKAHMKLQGNAEFNADSVLYDGEMEIKGRGNSTWLASKKPYKIKLGTKSNLLGMGKNKHWVLLSNPYDTSLSRNKLIYDLAEDMGLDSMSSQWIDVVFNGEVVGNYQLCEHVRIGSTRVDITDWDEVADDAAKAIYKANQKSMTKNERDELAELMEANMDWVTAGKITFKGKTYIISDYYELPSTNGGYLLEGFDAEKPYFASDGGYTLSVSKPEGIGKGMLEEIQGYYSAFERAAQSEDFCTEYNGRKVRYSDLADAESFAKGFLLNEIFQNQDFMYRSTYMYKDVDGKLVLGPVWDLDMSSDNSTNVFAHNRWVFFRGAYLFRMMRDPAFVKIIYDAYREYRYTAIEDMLKPGGDIDKAIEKIYESAEKNDMLWSIEPGFEKGIENFRLWLSRRLDWIDSQMTSFETFYASVNGSALNNSGSAVLKLDGSVLKVNMTDPKIASCEVYVNGVLKQSLTYSENITLDLGALNGDDVISAMSYDSDGKFLGMSSVTSGNEPIGIKITKMPTQTAYSSGDKINLEGLELKAVYADGSEKIVTPEAAVSYVSDCIGAQAPVYNEITDKIGEAYISLRYRGLKTDYKISKSPNEDSKKVEKLIENLPQSNFEDNLETVFEAKQEYDALSEAAKKNVSNSAKLEKTFEKINELSEKSNTPILGCYIDGLVRIGQKNSVVVIAKGSPNKIRLIYGGSVTTIPVANRDYCISEKHIAGYSVMTIIYNLQGASVDVGAYYNHVLSGEFYHLDAQRAVENRSRMICSFSYNKSLASTKDSAKFIFRVNKRVDMITASCDEFEITEIPENGKVNIEMNFASAGERHIDIRYYADDEWHTYKSVSIFVKDTINAEQRLALKYPSATGYDEVNVFAATASGVKTVRLVSENQTVNLISSEKNGFTIWQSKIAMDESKLYKVFVDSKDTGRTVKIEKLDKLVIENGTLVECRVNSGRIDVPYSVSQIADGALDGFNGTICCYKNSAAHKYAEKNGIKYINYGYAVDIPSELKMMPGESFTVRPAADPLIPPDFSVTAIPSDTSMLSGSLNGFKAIKPGYARITLKSNDGLINSEIKVYVGGGCTKGDINADGNINSYDALLTLKSAVELVSLNEEEKNAADINGDNAINSIDALIILQISTESRSIWDYV